MVARAVLLQVARLLPGAGAIQTRRALRLPIPVEEIWLILALIQYPPPRLRDPAIFPAIGAWPRPDQESNRLAQKREHHDTRLRYSPMAQKPSVA